MFYKAKGELSKPVEITEPAEFLMLDMLMELRRLTKAVHALGLTTDRENFERNLREVNKRWPKTQKRISSPRERPLRTG